MSGLGEPADMNEATAIQALTAAVNSRVRSEGRLEIGRAALWRLLGVGGMITLFGLGAGAALFGYSFVSDARPEAERMAEVLGQAISKSTLKVDANGEVTIAEGAEVSLKPGAKVGIDPRSLLRIDPNSTVRAVAGPPSLGAGLTEQQLQPEAQADSGNPVTTSYTVFKTTEYGPGQVSTSWSYASGEADVPEEQSCFFLMNVGGQRGLRVDIGENGRQLAPKRRIPNVNFNDAYRLCTWFSAT
jgi:hypothetical protein